MIAANISGKENGGARFLQPDERSPQNMPGAVQGEAHFIAQCLRLTKRHRAELFQCVSGILLGIEWQGGMVFTVAVAVGILGIFLLKIAAIGQHDPAEIKSGSRAVNRPGKTRCCQARDIAGVVNVRMGEQNGVQLIWPERRRCPVALTVIFHTLEQTGIYQQLAVVRLHQIFRPRNGAGRTKKSQFHTRMMACPNRLGKTG